MKIESKELFIYEGCEISLYINFNILLILSWSFYPIKEKERKWAFQIGILEIHLRFTKFSK